MSRKSKGERTISYQMRDGRRITVPISNDREDGFFRRAKRMFLGNEDYFKFEALIWGPRSLIFRRDRALGKDPFYIALRDMWLGLGIRQGYIAKSKKTKVRPTRCSH